MNTEWRTACREYRKKKIDAQVTINEAMQKGEERKLEEIKRKKCNKEWWIYLKEDESRDEDQDIDLKMNGGINKDRGKINSYIKKYWEQLGKVGSGEVNDQQIKFPRREIVSEQNYR